jgi:hypothetical protein
MDPDDRCVRCGHRYAAHRGGKCAGRKAGAWNAVRKEFTKITDCDCTSFQRPSPPLSATGCPHESVSTDPHTCVVCGQALPARPAAP